MVKITAQAALPEPMTWFGRVVSLVKISPFEKGFSVSQGSDSQRCQDQFRIQVCVPSYCDFWSRAPLEWMSTVALASAA